MDNPSVKDKDTPVASWANWALIAAWFERQCQGEPFPDDKRPELAEVMAKRFKDTLGEREHGPRSYVILTNAGLWGVGKTLVEAVKNSKSYSKTHLVTALLVLNDDKPTVDSWGTVHSSSLSSQFNLGIVGTVGSILNANKPK